MYCDGYKGRLRTTMIALVATGVGCMRTTMLTVTSWTEDNKSVVMEASVG